MCLNNILTTPPIFPFFIGSSDAILAMNGIHVDLHCSKLFLNIFAAAQDTELKYQTSSTMNAVISVLVFSKYFVCGMNTGAPELNMSDFPKFEADTQRSVSEIYNPLKYYSV